MVGDLGSGATSEGHLDRAARRQGFGHLWHGVMASDEVSSSARLPGYMIINLDPRELPGSHWVACCTDSHGVHHVYDSFGRMVTLSNLPGRILYSDISDAEQHTNEHNCGQRSLAWLCTLHECGISCAMFI